MAANMLLHQHTPSLARLTDKKKFILLQKLLANLSVQEAKEIREWFQKPSGLLDMCHVYPDNKSCEIAAVQYALGHGIKCGDAWGLFNRSLSHA